MAKWTVSLRLPNRNSPIRMRRAHASRYNWLIPASAVLMVVGLLSAFVDLRTISADASTANAFLQNDWSGGIGSQANQFAASTNIQFTSGPLQLLSGAVSGNLTSRIFDAGEGASFGQSQISASQGLGRLGGTKNLLPNASFEWGVNGSLEGWEAAGFDTMEVLTSTVTNQMSASRGAWAYLGSNWFYAGSYYVASPAGLRVSIPVTISSALAYTLSADFKLLNATAGELIGSVVAYDAAGQELGQIEAFRKTVGSTTWGRYAGVISFSPGFAGAVKARPQIAFAGPYARYMLDAIQFEEGTATSFHEGYGRSTVAIYARAGNTPTPDATWSRWQRVTTWVPTELSGKRYLQYQVALARTSTTVPSPSVTQLRFVYTTPVGSAWRINGQDLQRTSFQIGASNIMSPTVRWKVRTGGTFSSFYTAGQDLLADKAPLSKAEPIPLLKTAQLSGNSTQMVLAEAGRIRAANLSNGQDLWVSTFLEPNVTVEGIADLSGDGQPEVLVSGNPRFTFWVLQGKTGQVLCEDENGWRHGYGAANSVFEDVTGDGIKDWVATAFDGSTWITYMWNLAGGWGSGGVCPRVWQTLHLYFDSHATQVGDVDGDGRNEVVVFDPMVIRVLDGSTGSVLAQYPNPGIYGEATRLVVKDIDGDGRAEIIAHSWSDRVIYGGNLMALKYAAGSLTALWTVLDNGTWLYGSNGENWLLKPNQRIADVSYDWNGDGVIDVVFQVDLLNDSAHVRIYSGQDGTLLADLSQQIEMDVADWDADGQPELLTYDTGTLSWRMWEYGVPQFVNRWSFTPTCPWWQVAVVDNAPAILAGCDNRLRVYRDGGSTAVVQRNLSVPTEWISGVQAIGETATQSLVVLYGDGTATVWDWNTDTQQSQFQVGNWAAPIAAVPMGGTDQVIFQASQGYIASVQFPQEGESGTIAPSTVYPNSLSRVYLPESSGGGYVETTFDSRTQLFEKNGNLVWSRPFYMVLLGYGNFDGTGRLDIFGVSGDGYVALSGDTGNTLWKRAFSAYFPRVLAINDLNDDGRDDIVVIWGWAISGADGTPFRHYPRHEDVRSYIVNLNEDPEPEIVGASGGYELSVYGRDGRLLWGMPLGTDGFETTMIAPTFMDADGDGIKDIALPNAAGRLRILRGRDGTLLGDLFLSGGKRVLSSQQGLAPLSDAVSADIDGDGSPEIIVGAGDGWLYAIRPSSGQIVWTYNLTYPVRSLVLADVDGDERLEIVASVSDGFLYVLDRLPYDIFLPFAGHNAAAEEKIYMPLILRYGGN